MCCVTLPFTQSMFEVVSLMKPPWEGLFYVLLVQRLISGSNRPMYVISLTSITK